MARIASFNNQIKKDTWKGKGLYLAFLLDSKGVVLQQKQRCQYSYQRHHLRTHFELFLFAHKTNC